MRAYLGLLLIGALVAMAMAANPFEKDLTMATEACQKEHKIDETEYINMFLGKIPRADSSENLRCWTRCVMEKFKIMDPETSEFKPDMMKKVFRDSQLFKGALKKCESLDDENACEKAFAITVCLMKEVFDQR